MRHARARRGYRVILLLLFALSSVILAESRIEALVPELKAMAEMRVGQALGGDTMLAIGSVDGGIIGPIVLNGVRLEQEKGSALFRTLVINNIRTNYKFWDLLRMKGANDVGDALQKGSSVYVDFSAYDGGITGFAGIEGSLKESRISGYVRLFGSDKIEFALSVKGDNFDLMVRPGSGSLRFTGAISDDGFIDAGFKAEHIKVRGSDIVCEGRIRNRILAPSSGGNPGAEGEIETSHISVDHRDLPNIRSAYSLANGELKVSGLVFGDGLRASGSVGLRKPNALDITLLVDNLSLSKLLLSFGIKDAASMVSGTMNGKFILKGQPGKMNLESRFDIRNGTMGELDFSCLSASLKGDLPFLKIEEARLTRPSGYLELEGEVDLAKVGKNEFFRNVKLVTDDNAIAWDKWDSVRRRDVNELSMSKKLTSDIGIRYKKYVNENGIGEDSREGDEVRLEYKLTSSESLGIMVGKDEDFFGFEHRDKF